MKYYIAENQRPVGPFDVNELLERGIKSSDLVWCEGMKDWAPAETVTEIQEALLAAREAAGYRETAIPDLPQEGNDVPPPPPYNNAYNSRSTDNGRGIEMPPKTWLVESILVTLFCCLPFGIVGIIKAANVSSLWQSGRYEEARNASSSAKKWTIAGFVCGIILCIICGAISSLIRFFD